MKDINELVENIEEYRDIVVHKKFKSKKNTVAYVTFDNKPRIIKWFAPGFKHLMKNEYNILKKGSSKIKIPFPYEMDEKNNIIITSYIIGENLCDIVNDEKTSYNEKNRLMTLLANWFVDFHSFFKTPEKYMIRGDSILRNFILTDHIWGVDFEESRNGEPVEDIAGMCSSILSTDPMFTDEKLNLCKKFIEVYSSNMNWVIEKINENISYALLEKIQWRPEQEHILRDYSNKIKKKGLDL